MKKTITLSLSILCTIALLSQAGAGESVGWRTDGTGMYPAAKPVLTWGADKNVLWKTPLPSWSNATPVIVGNKLFVCAEPATLVCVDKNEGTILWKQEMIAAEQKSGKRPRTHGTNGYTSMTPVTDGRHVFTLTGYGAVAAFDMTGKREWLTRLKPPNHGWGTSASPVLVDGKVIVHIPPVVTALNAADGKPAWTAKSNGAWGTPLVVTVGGKKAIYTTGGRLIAAADGTVIGRGRALPWTSPVSDGKRLYVADIDGAAALDLPAAAVPNARLEEAWKLPVTGRRKRRHYASPLLHDGLLYAVTENGHFTVIDAATGALAYERALKLGGTTFPSIVLAGEHLLVSSDRGKTVVLKPGRAYAETGRNTLEPFRATPVFDGGRMYVRGLRHLYCIGKGSNEPPPAPK
jgi:outer membrane protein assembly factor BamB